MKLYFAPGACSLSPHIVLREAGYNFHLEQVNNQEKKTKSGMDYWGINGKGQVPVLELDNGERITEGPVIVQYLADLKPESGLAPRAGTFERYQLMEILNYLTSEVHKTFTPLFNPASSAEAKEAAVTNLGKKFDWLSGFLGKKPFLLGNTFTVADAYLFTLLTWTGHVKVDLAKWPVLADYKSRIAKRPKVIEAMKAEGLIK